MTKNNHIGQLIENLCPSGVQHMTLDKLCVSIKTGLNPRQNFVLNVPDATLYYVTVKEITTGKIVFSDRTDRITKNAWSRIQERSMLEKDDILFSGIGTIGKVAIVDIPTDNWNCSESVFLIKPNKSLINPKYLMYYLGSEQCKEQYESDSVGSTLKGVRKGTLESLQIPVPPMEIQNEVVRLLDSFSNLIENINTEIKARQRQLELFRTSAFSKFGTQCKEWKSLGEVLNYEQPGKYIVSDTNYNNSYPTPVLTAGQSFILGYTNETEGIYKASKDNPTIIFDDFTTSFHWVDFDFKVKSSAMKMLRPRKDVEVAFRYVFYAMRCINFEPSEHTRYWISKYSTFTIPLPSLKEQQAIAAKLDTIEAFIANLNEERALRQQQYEYYRAKLISLLK